MYFYYLGTHLEDKSLNVDDAEFEEFWISRGYKGSDELNGPGIFMNGEMMTIVCLNGAN